MCKHRRLNREAEAVFLREFKKLVGVSSMLLLFSCCLLLPVSRLPTTESMDLSTSFHTTTVYLKSVRYGESEASLGLPWFGQA